MLGQDDVDEGFAAPDHGGGVPRLVFTCGGEVPHL